jgi:hypothetical protein
MVTRRRRIDWQAISVAVFLFITVIGWGVSIEVRMAQHTSYENLIDRVENIETNMLPVLVDYKVRKILEDEGYSVDEKEVVHAQAKKWAETQLKNEK